MLARTKVSIALAAAAVALTIPAAAGADTVSVNGATGNNNGGACGHASDPFACKDIQFGAARAQGLAGPDEIVVAPGTYAEIVSIQGQGDSLVGAGSCADPATCTIIQPAAGTIPVVTSTVNNDNGSISGVRIVATNVAAGNRIGLQAQGANTVLTDSHVEINAPSSTQSAIRIEGEGSARVERTSVDSDGDGDGIYTVGVTGSFSLIDSNIHTDNRTALFLGSSNTSAVVRRSVLRENLSPGGFAGYVVGGSPGGPVRIESSLVMGGHSTVGVGAPVTVVGSTLDSGDPGGSSGSAVDTSPAGATAAIRDSLLVGFVYTTGGGVATCATSDVAATAGVNAPTCVAGTAGNTTSADTDLFVDFANRDYRLKPGSPAVDSGSDTALDPAETTDVAGAPRVLDGNQDCVARRDRGAYELTGFAAGCPAPPQQSTPPPPPPPQRDTRTPTMARLAAGPTKLTFRLSEAAKVSVRIDRKGKKGRRTVYKKVGSFSVSKAKAGANSVKVPSKLARALKGKPATYRVTLVATDAAGNRSKQARKSFTVKPAKKKKRKRG